MSQLPRQAQGKKGSYGHGAHGRQIAKPARQGTMPGGFRGMPIHAEMGSGNGQVGGDGQFLASTRTQQGAIVPDAETNGPRI